MGFLLKDQFSFIIVIGVFALSGSITNLLAIHMLFDKVPFLYGSGVILDRFEDIKLVILPDNAKTPITRIKENSSLNKKPIKIIKVDIKFVIKDLFITVFF